MPNTVIKAPIPIRASTPTMASIPVRVPNSFPNRVPQPYGYNPSPLQPPADYYVTRKEVKELLESINPPNLDDYLKKNPEATEGSIAVFDKDGGLKDSMTLVEALRETLSSDAAAIAKIMEILTSRDEASRASALEIKEMLDNMPNPDDMTQGEKTDFILKLVEYALVKEDVK